MTKEGLKLNRNEWEKNVLKFLKEHALLREKQMKNGTLCHCGATTPKEHLGVCDYCWEEFNQD